MISKGEIEAGPSPPKRIRHNVRIKSDAIKILRWLLTLVDEKKDAKLFDSCNRTAWWWKAGFV